MTPHPDDNKILLFNAGLGHRLRVLRQTRQLSQKALADALGISFQQLQKYERGSNRLTVDRLIQVSHILGVGAAYFLDEPAQAHLPPAGVNKIVLCLAGEVMNIPDVEVRKSLYHLIRTLGKAMNENGKKTISEPTRLA
ncbi:MAG: helix-turn-helix transcriptional regulator [Alphaproteobacteria bacterium]|nr:helix-turn-helix transcriptional regulator [Alphaproteobacteria bacterium]MBN8520340.1 helix-turn-helix transcriptional regulator [Alphaproteobacteria bacterium]